MIRLSDECLVITSPEDNNHQLMTKKRKASDERRENINESVLGMSRSISACQRCRLKKIRCDQNFPKCSKCEKSNAECVGMDPISGMKIPRSYVMHLEDRISHLEGLLKQNGISLENKTNTTGESDLRNGAKKTDSSTVTEKKGDEEQKQQSRASTVSNISFAKLMYTSLNVHKDTSQERIDPLTTNTKKYGLPAILPSKKTAQEFIKIYFSQSNSQVPIFHREEFILKYFMPIYGKMDDDILLASNYIPTESRIYAQDMKDEDTWFYQYKKEFLKRLQNNESNADPNEISSNIITPSEFHIPLYFLSIVFAIGCSVHQLQYHSNISNSFKVLADKYFDSVYHSKDQMEKLEGFLSLTLYSMMRPAVPSAWYIIGPALRICVDKGLHNEMTLRLSSIDSFTKDKRRRLFWCTYSMDRQLCFYLGRSVGIQEESISTPFPSELDDSVIIPGDKNNDDYLMIKSEVPTYKSIAISIFKIRIIQSEVQKVLYENSEIPRMFLNLQEWKDDIMDRLQIWKTQLPKTQQEMNCDFNLDFFSLNYNYTSLKIHGLSPRNNQLSIVDFLNVDTASKEIIKCYNQLHVNKCLNYTWAAVHNLYYAGTCYLYAIYNSEDVKKRNNLYEVKIITQECITVLNALVDRCNAAPDCRDSFEALTAAVVKLIFNENVKGSASSIPTAQQISRNQPVGYENPNLNKLVEKLETKSKSEENKNDIQRSSHSEVKSSSNKDFDYFDYLNHENPELRLPFTFEWVSVDDSARNPSNNFTNIDDSHNGLNNFFNCLETLLPTQDDSGANNKHRTFSNDRNSIDQDHRSNAFDQASIQPNANEQSQREIYVGDDRGQFEMIHQMPVETIWDQFLTGLPSSNVNSLGLPLNKNNRLDNNERDNNNNNNNRHQ